VRETPSAGITCAQSNFTGKLSQAGARGVMRRLRRGKGAEMLRETVVRADFALDTLLPVSYSKDRNPVRASVLAGTGRV
jgi:hypothetical protein